MRGPRAVVVLAKWPTLRSGKQRLAQEVGHAAARDLARAFLADTLALADQADARVVIASAPAAAAPRFQALAPHATVVRQRRADFGERIDAALGAGLRLARAVVLVGTDAPTMPPARIARAFALLDDRTDIVLGPSDDGGFYLIGCRAPLPRGLLEAIPWSTSAVLRETEARVAARRLRIGRLRSWYDVDDLASLRRLGRDAGGLRRAPHTARVLGSVPSAA